MSRWSDNRTRRFAVRAGIALYILTVALSFVPRIQTLNTPLLDVHPVRQGLTGYITQLFVEGKVGLLDYRYPSDGSVFRLIQELPVVQALAAVGIRTFHCSLETGCRSTTLLFFLVSTVLLFFLLLRFVSRPVAWTTVLLYLIHPFNIVYSRSCLIDYPAQTVFMASLLCFLKAFDSDGKQMRRYLACASVLASVGAMIKGFVWIPYSVLFAGYSAFWLYQRRWPKRPTVYLIIFLGIQTIAALAWTKWGSHLRENGAINPGWLFGAFADRFHPSNWVQHVRSLFRDVLSDWLVPLFVIGACVPVRPLRKLSLACLTLTVFPVLILFNVFKYHEYYYIIQMPFLFGLVAIGLVSVFERRNWIRYGVLSLTVALLAYRVAKFEPTFGAMYAGGLEHLAVTDRIQALTEPSDRLIVQDEFNSWWLPLYAKRLVLLEEQNMLPEFYDRAGITVVLLRKQGANADLLPNPSAAAQLGDVEGRWTAYRIRPAPAR